MTRSIQAPGFEFNEIDNSTYNKNIDYSLPNAPVCFIAGYANSGLDYVPQYINSLNTLNFQYGYPENDEERYFYNGIIEIINQRGICIAAKIPYDNEQKQRYSYVDYAISNIVDLSAIGLSAITDLDNSLNKCLLIQNVNDKNIVESRLSAETLYELRAGKQKIQQNTIRIIDISHTCYSKANFNCISSASLSSYTNDCLGILPIITTPVNAMCFQDLIPDESLMQDGTINVSSYNNISYLKVCKLKDQNRLSVNLAKFNDNSQYSLSSIYKYDTTVSRKTSQLFPKISWKNNTSYTQINQKYNKCIGIVVLKMFLDQGNDNNINYSILESFVGSLDSTDNKSGIQFIDDIVNDNSQYINVITNIASSKLNTSDIVGIQNQAAQSLGFYNIETTKNIKANSTLEDLQLILKKIENTHQFPIDLVVDGGVSNIAQKYMQGNGRDYQYYNGLVWNQTLSSTNDTTNWNKALRIFENFCRSTRGDCMYIADCLKSFSMDNDEKIVSYYNTNTVRDNILTKMKYLPTINSSYAAGYSNWIKMYDAYSNTQFWAPPSIKAVCSYIYCSTYKHTWNAPAGVQNGTISNATDISFNPTVSEAETLYINNWNYFASYPTYGIVIDGQKTFQTETTALDRINVRRLMLYIEREIADICRKYLYQLGTKALRTKLNTELSVFLTSIQNGSGISEYAILCDDTNNTAETIDRNELHVKIAVKPIKVVEFIIVSFIITNQSASVSEAIS